MERSAITVMGGLPPRELARVHEITPLTGPEQELVTSWRARTPGSPAPATPAAGKYLIKTGRAAGHPGRTQPRRRRVRACTTLTRPSAAGTAGVPVSRAIGPRPPLAHRERRAGVGACIAACWGLVALAWLAWAAARVAAAAGGGHVPPFGARWVSAPSARPYRPGLARRPHAPRRRCRAVFAGVPGAIAVATWRAVSRRATRPGDPVAALSRNQAVRRLAQARPPSRAIRLRPSLAGASPGGWHRADIGLLLGRLKQPGGHGPDLFTSWEDTVLAFMGPRSGKTTCLGIPYVLSAPGPVVATSVRADLWAATAELRAAAGSGIWVFDPQRITAAGQRWWWNPLAGHDQRRGGPPAGRPLRPDRRRQHARATSGAGRPGTADQPAAGRRLLTAHAAGGVPVAG